MSSTVTLKINQQTTLSLSPVDNSGNFAPINGIPSWTQTNSGIAELKPSPSGMSATIIGKNVGTTIITARSTGAGGALSVSTTINVITNLATNIALTSGPVITKPAISTAGSMGMNPNIAQQKINNYNKNPAKPLSTATPATNKLQHFKPAVHQPPKGTVVPPIKPTVRTKQDKMKNDKKDKPKVPELKMPVLTPEIKKPEQKPEVKLTRPPMVQPAQLNQPIINPPPKPVTAPVVPVVTKPLVALPMSEKPPALPTSPPPVLPHMKPTPSDTIKQAMAQVKRSGGCGCGGRR